MTAKCRFTISPIKSQRDYDAGKSIMIQKIYKPTHWLEQKKLIKNINIQIH